MQNETLVVFFPDMFEDFDGLNSVVKLILEFKSELGVDFFLVPDQIYDFLESLLKPVKYDFEEYSTRKWLTGFVPDIDRATFSKIHVIINRNDVRKVSDLIPALMDTEDPYEQVLSTLEYVGEYNIHYIGSNEAINFLEKQDIVFGFKPIKGHKHVYKIEFK